MNIFEQFANQNEEKNKVEVAATNNNVAVEDEYEDEGIVDERLQEEEELDDEIDESFNLVDDGKGNLMMHIPEDPKTLAENNKKNENKNSKKDNKKKKIEVKPVVPQEPKKTAEELIEEKFKDYTKLIVKVFGRVELQYDDPTEVKLLKIEDVKNILIADKGYDEFANGIVWSLTPGTEPTIGYLIPTYKFHPKG